MNNSKAIWFKRASLLLTTAVYVLLCNLQPQVFVNLLQDETLEVVTHAEHNDETEKDNETVFAVASPNALLPAAKIFIDQSFHSIKATFNLEPVRSSQAIYLEYTYNPIVSVLFPLIISPNAP